MALYSQELRRYIDHFSQYQVPSPSIKEKIAIGTPKLFDFDYPFFDPSKKADFEKRWVQKFYMVEIGFETIPLFKLYLETWMNENMPYYNQRFKSELIEFDPLKNTEMVKGIDFTKSGSNNLNTTDDGHFETHSANDSETKSNTNSTMNADGTVDSNGTSSNDSNGTKKGNNKNTSNSDEFARMLESNTPDKRLAITTEDGKGVIQYASKINENTDKNHEQQDITIDENTTGNSSGNTTDKSVSHDEATSTSATTGEGHDVGKVTGTDGRTGNKTGSSNESGNTNENYVGKIGVETYSEMLEKYRATFLRIEQEIYEQCRAELFSLAY